MKLTHYKGWYDYIILEQKAYDRYFWGRKPSHKRAFTWVTEGPGRTLREAADKFEKNYGALTALSGGLLKAKIIEKRIRKEIILRERIEDERVTDT